MKIAVVDDVPRDAQLLVQFLNRFQAEQGISLQIHPFYSSIDFLEEYDGTYDIVFLDIEMPGSDGLTAAREIRSRDDAVAIIFITNMAQYAIHGYEVNAIDFMIKPVGYFNFAQKLGKAMRFLQRRGQSTVLLTGEDGVIRLAAYFLCASLWYLLLNQFLRVGVLAQVVYYFGLFVMTLAGIRFCFDLIPMELIFVGTGGYATEHIAFALGRIIQYATGWNEERSSAPCIARCAVCWCCLWSFTFCGRTEWSGNGR